MRASVSSTRSYSLSCPRYFILIALSPRMKTLIIPAKRAVSSFAPLGPGRHSRRSNLPRPWQQLQWLMGRNYSCARPHCRQSKWLVLARPVLPASRVGMDVFQLAGGPNSSSFGSPVTALCPGPFPRHPGRAKAAGDAARGIALDGRGVALPLHRTGNQVPLALSDVIPLQSAEVGDQIIPKSLTPKGLSYGPDTLSG
jgi:hypothetical protein